MKSVVFSGNAEFDVIEESRPELSAGHVLLRPLSVGICFTEKHYAEGKWGYYPEGARLGHEGVGVIVDVADDVEGFEVGQRVCVDPKPRCGVCLMCRGGTHSYYPKLPYTCALGPESRAAGLLTELAAVQAYKLRAVPDSLSHVAAANVEPFANGTRAVRHAGFVVGDNVLVLGMEDYAFAAVQWMRNGGANAIIVADPIESRRQDALRAGADHAVHPAEVAELVASVFPFGADLVFASVETYLPEATDYLSQAVEHARLQGTVVISRIYQNDALQRVDAPTLWMKEISLKGFGFCWGEETWRGGEPRGDFQVTIDAIAKGRIDADSHTLSVPFDSLSSPRDVRELMSSIPLVASKVHITVSDE